jgi:hypothetical protein
MDCFKCGKRGHNPARFCPNGGENSSDSSKSSKGSMTDFTKQLKAVKKSFAQLQAANKSDDSSSSNDDQLHVQYFQFTQWAEEPRATVLHQTGKLNNLDLREVILLDNQSTLSLFCNPNPIVSKKRSDKPLKLQSSGGTLLINHVAEIGEGQFVWFLKRASTNILSLKHVKKTTRCQTKARRIHSPSIGRIVDWETWFLRCTRVVYTIMTREERISASSLLSKATNSLSPNDTSRQQKRLGASMPAWGTHQFRISSGYSSPTKLSTAQ